MEGGLDALYYMWRKFCQIYLIKHKEWPPLRVLDRLPGNLQLSIDTGTWQEDPKNKWNLEEFPKIELLKAFDLDKITDETSILADKAVSVGLDSWPRKYDTRNHRLRYGKGCKLGPVRNRRLLLEHISRKVNVFEDALSFMKGDDYNTRIAVNCFKERVKQIQRKVLH